MRGVNYRGRTFYAMAPGRPEQQALGMQRSHPRQPLDPTPTPPHTHTSPLPYTHSVPRPKAHTLRASASTREHPQRSNQQPGLPRTITAGHIAKADKNGTSLRTAPTGKMCRPNQAARFARCSASHTQTYTSHQHHPSPTPSLPPHPSANSVTEMNADVADNVNSV